VPKSRLGVAVLVPPPACHEVDGLRRALGDPSLGRIPAHLTLVPPVNVRTDRLADALAVLRRAAAASRPFRLTLGPPATFLPVNPVAYLAVTGDLAALQTLRDRVFTPPLERTLTWPFVPHVTIADEAEPARIEAALQALADFTVEMPVDRVHLLEEGEGRIWRPIADARFAAPAVVGRGGGLEVELTVTERLDAEAAAFSEREWAVYDTETQGSAYDYLAVTARRDGRVLGTAAGHVVGTAAHLAELLVAAPERGTGIGSHLLNAFISEVAERGATTVTLRTVPGSPAEQFYRDRGWVEDGRLPGRVQLRRDLTRRA
jgi:2'-5' RNA ligase/predicted N-acetyltransferase YhbS